MTYPLVVLAVASVFGGFFGICQFARAAIFPGAAKTPIFAPLEPFKAAPLAATLGLAAFAIGLWSRIVSFTPARTRTRCPANCRASAASCAINFILTKFTPR